MDNPQYVRPIVLVVSFLVLIILIAASRYRKVGPNQVLVSTVRSTASGTPSPGSAVRAGSGSSRAAARSCCPWSRPTRPCRWS